MMRENADKAISAHIQILNEIGTHLSQLLTFIVTFNVPTSTFKVKCQLVPTWRPSLVHKQTFSLY